MAEDIDPEKLLDPDSLNQESVDFYPPDISEPPLQSDLKGVAPERVLRIANRPDQKKRDETIDLTFSEGDAASEAPDPSDKKSGQA